MRGLRFLGLFVAASALTGCGTVIQSNVRSYGAFPTKSAGESRGTYSIFTADQDQRSLERATYTERVRAGMKKNGFEEAPDGKAEYVLLYTYNIKVTGQQGEYSAPIGVPGTGAFATGFNIGAAAGGGKVSSSDVCTRYFAMRLYRSTDVDVDKQPLYERQVRSTGGSCDLGAVLPTIIDSAFESFPGESGKTYQVELPLNQ